MSVSAWCQCLKGTARGDFLSFMRLLFSHLHEAGITVRRLDTNGKKRVNAVLAGNRDAVAALKTVRKVFNAGDYDKSWIARVRNSIGFHYNAEVTTLVKAEVTDDALLESTVAEVGRGIETLGGVRYVAAADVPHTVAV